MTVQTVQELMSAVDTTALSTRPLSDWRPILSKECQVYVCGETYLAKRFDQINYKFCEKNEAKEIVVDNIYALLRYKYFPKSSEEIDERIGKIVSNFTANLKTTLRKVSFDNSADCDVMHQLPDYCIAFRNGVFDFKKNEWYFKYDIVDIEHIANKLYMYRNDMAIMWYFNYDFEPLPVKITETPLTDFIEMMKVITAEKETRNYCFELLYNISHDSSDKYSLKKFEHLCQILGYSVLQSFSQYFILLIGSGQNGKNSLFDGCFTHRIIPRPAANDLDSIENDRFISGSLENKAQNIFLETSAKTYTESKMIKALTGSMYQTIENKGVSKYSSIINCKYIFAGNDQDKIKFSDNTTGFRRRINMLEIYYQWDSQKRFLKRGDYYDTSFSDDLHELKYDIANTTAYIYFAMYGIMIGTKNFNSNFQFTLNDWNYKYADVDLDLKEKIENITPQTLAKYLETSKVIDEAKTALFDTEKSRLYMSRFMKELGYTTVEEMLTMLKTPELSVPFFSEHDIYISVRTLQNITKELVSAIAFSASLKKLYMITQFESLYANKPYVKCTFVNSKLRLLK